MENLTFQKKRPTPENLAKISAIFEKLTPSSVFLDAPLLAKTLCPNILINTGR